MPDHPPPWAEAMARAIYPHCHPQDLRIVDTSRAIAAYAPLRALIEAAEDIAPRGWAGPDRIQRLDTALRAFKEPAP